MTSNTPHNKMIVKFLIAGIIIPFFFFNSFALIWENGSGGSYEDPGGGNGGTAALSSFNSIEYYVIQGAGYFLAANSDIQRLLNRVELSSIRGCDSDELLSITDGALYNMDQAGETYYRLIKTAEVTPYNKTVIKQLMAFDYDAFMYQIDAAPGIYKEVSEYLKAGDVTGNYKRSYRKLIEIFEILQEIRAAIESEGMPDISTLWKLNQEVQKTLLGGQYVAQIFEKLSDESSS